MEQTVDLAFVHSRPPSFLLAAFFLLRAAVNDKMTRRHVVTLFLKTSRNGIQTAI
jgi:hypothetical protein